MARCAVPAALLLCTVVVQARQPERARHAMIVAGDPLAVDAGLKVLRNGGNAVDAAVAVGFALAATYPYAGNLGGGGFMLIRFADGRSTFIDFREKAPAKATRDMYLDAQGHPTKESLEGWRSSGVPGTVRGFELAQRKYGRAKWADLVEPGVQLASRGFPVTYAFATSLREAENLPRDPESKRIFLKNGAYYDVGETFVQPDLAKTLKRIQAQGAKEFYEGETAKLLADAMAAHGGTITREDLKNYQAVERTPLTGKYEDYGIITSPPPSSGGIGILEMLGMLEGTGYQKAGAGSAASIHYMAEAMRRFFADRSEYMADPDFYKVPVTRLLDPAYLAGRRASIDPVRATPSSKIHPGLKAAGRESAETTHYDVVDAEGNAVAVTYTINDGFGNGITVPGAGFLLNNEMDDFAAKPGAVNLFGLKQGEANAIEPGKRPLSSMTPTIVTRGGKLFMVVGAPGGSHIPTAVLEAMLNVIDFGMNAQEAVDYPRFHHQWVPDELTMERGFSPDTIALLRNRGYDVHVEGKNAGVDAVVEAIVNEGGWLAGAADGRRPGKAAGY